MRAELVIKEHSFFLIFYRIPWYSQYMISHNNEPGVF